MTKIQLPSSRYSSNPCFAEESHFETVVATSASSDKILRRCKRMLNSLPEDLAAYQQNIAKGTTEHPQPRIYVTRQHIFYRVQGAKFLKVTFGSKFASISNGTKHKRFKLA
jgi:hypothetical protein